MSSWRNRFSPAQDWKEPKTERSVQGRCALRAPVPAYGTSGERALRKCSGAKSSGYLELGNRSESKEGEDTSRAQ